MKKVKTVYFALCLGLIVIVSLLNSEYFFSNLQIYLESFNSIKISNALIQKPKNWLVVYKKDEQDNYELSYGYIPYGLSNQSRCLVFFVVKKLDANNKVVFCKMNSDYVAKSKSVLEKLLNNPNNNDIKIVKVGGFDSLISSPYQTNLLIDIPILGISIVTNNVDDLSQFTFTRVDDVIRP